MRITKTMLKQLAYTASIPGGATTAGCGDGDFNRYIRLLDTGLVAWVPGATRVAITEAGKAFLKDGGSK